MEQAVERIHGDGVQLKQSCICATKHSKIDRFAALNLGKHLGKINDSEIALRNNDCVLQSS